MADQEATAQGKANGTAEAGGMSKKEAVKRVLADKGPGLKPPEISDEVKRRFNIDLTVGTAKTYKRDILAKGAKGSSAKPTAKKAAAAKKPAATQASAAKKTPPAAKAATAQAAAGASGYNLSDIQSTRNLLARIGAGRLRELVDVLAR